MRAVLSFWLLCSLLLAGEWVLVGHPGMLTQPNAKQLRALYLGRLHFIGDQRAFPLTLPASDPLRERFETEILGMSQSALRNWWIRRHYLGERPPRVVGSEQSVLAYVQAVEGAVGYVREALAKDANVTILFRSGERP